MEYSTSAVLPQERADRYLRQVAALLAGGHLNGLFPPVARLQAYMTALHSRTHGGLYPQIVVEHASGLPALHEWRRVQIDKEQAATILGVVPGLTALEEGLIPSEFVEQPFMLRYFMRLHELPIEPMDSLRMEVKKIAPDASTAQIRLLLDKMDAASPVMRCMVEMSVSLNEVESQQLLVRWGDELMASPELQARLSLLASTSAEHTFLELSAVPGVRVQRVSRTTVGPFCLAEIPTSLPVRSLLAGPSAVLGTFALDVASRDVPRDFSNDPLKVMLGGEGNESVQAEHERARIRLGYHVYRDRKFVTDPGTQPTVEALCRDAGTRNIIYTTAAGDTHGEASS